jgi:hypothetical protein
MAYDYTQEIVKYGYRLGDEPSNDPEDYGEEDPA